MLHVNPHGEHCDVNEPVLGLHTLRQCFESEDAADRLPEVTRVVRGLEADEVRSEDTAEEVLAHGETAEDLRGREGGVHEEANWRGGQRSAQETRKEHQVVIVHPD
jgi:hypothetical protein